MGHSGQGSKGAATLAELNEATFFERFALGTMTPLSRPLYGWVDLRGPGDGGANVGVVDQRADILAEARRFLGPLMFGAAWKIIDLAVEYALPNKPRGHWTIDDKIKKAGSDTPPPAWAPFTDDDDHWRAALKMYASTADLRHSLIHRREQLSESMSPDEQLAFCRATQRLISAILAERIEPRHRDDLAYQLAQISGHSGLEITTTGPVQNICELHINFIDDSPDWFALDTSSLDATMKHQRGYQAFDLVAYKPHAPGEPPLVGKLEDVTLDLPVMRFRKDDLPTWLSSSRRPQTLPV